jgi:hypothetical protein
MAFSAIMGIQRVSRVVAAAPPISLSDGADGLPAQHLLCVFSIDTSQHIRFACPICLSGRAVEIPNGMYNPQNLTIPVARAIKPTTATTQPRRLPPANKSNPARKRTVPSVTRKILSIPPTLFRSMAL